MTEPETSRLPALRLSRPNEAPVRRDGAFVLYWMIAARRTEWTWGLERAVEWARELDRPLVVLEPLRCDYAWASDRLHAYVLEGMVDNQARCVEAGVAYYPYVEPERAAGKGLLAALAERACVVVTDDFPCFFLPRMVGAAAERLAVRLEAVDGNGLLPLRAAEKGYSRAVDFRRFLQKTLPSHLVDEPLEDPLTALGAGAGARGALGELVGEETLSRWPAADLEALLRDLRPGAPGLAELPIDHEVAVAAEVGGAVAARRRLGRFLEGRLDRYVRDRMAVRDRATSELSPALHFGHLSVHEAFRGVIQQEGWNPQRLGTVTRGSREGWWGMSPEAESFLDELVTWREVGFAFTHRHPDTYDRFDSLPAWALKSLGEHADDPRPELYTPAELEAAATASPLWNAAQRELVRDGRIHNYLRMLWGKKIFEWSPSPQAALEVMIHLNNKYALDGRDPNSYSGIFWCLGRFDRAWGPVRPIFGKIRFMSLDSTRRKLDAKSYEQDFGDGLSA